MTNGLKVHSEYVKKVQSALKLNKYLTQKDLAEELGLALSTVSNFLNGKRVSKENFLEICNRLGLDWKEIADLELVPKTVENEEVVGIRVFISHRPYDLDRQIAHQFFEALSDDGYEVFMTRGSIRPIEDELKHIDEKLIKCDYLLLVISPKSAVSEMLIEEVRRARELRDLSCNGRPIPLIIWVGLPLNAHLNYDLRSYLQETWQREWQSNTDPTALIQEVRNLLGNGDVLSLSEHPAAITTLPPAQENLESSPLPVADPQLPEGQVELASVFYIDRPPIEERCYAIIGKPGALIRIKAPRQMGKTSLMARILYQAAKIGYVTVPLSFQIADATVFTNLDKFLQWFCSSIAWQLELPNKLTDYWNTIVGSKMSCTTYFEKYLLPKIVSPLVLGLDEVDRVFQYPEIAADFFGLLRYWHEQAKNSDCWKRLRLVVVHSTEVYLPLDLNQSPFNVGLPIQLPEFTDEQVHNLVQRYKLNLGIDCVEQLMAMVGGHPFLVQLALYEIVQQKVSLEQLLLTALTENGIYSDHLIRHFWNLTKYPELMTAMKYVVSAPEAVRLEMETAFKLHSMGLVHLQGNDVTPRCELYRQYFYDRLGVI